VGVVLMRIKAKKNEKAREDSSTPGYFVQKMSVANLLRPGNSAMFS
jgi:hypothetical protein